MNDPFRNYDAWLEAPIQRAYAESDAYVDWCEAEGIDPDNDDNRLLYEEYIGQMEEEIAERRAEDQAEALLLEHEDGREP